MYLGKGMVIVERSGYGSSWQDEQSRKGLRRGLLVSQERPSVSILLLFAHAPTLILQTLGG